MERDGKVLSLVLRGFDRIPWTFILIGFLVDAVSVLGAVYGSKAIQAAIQGLVVGSIYVLGASGLSLTYGIKKFANFAHGDMMTVGAYAAFTVNVLWGLNILWGAVFAMLSVALLGMLLWLAFFGRPEGGGPVPRLTVRV